MPAYRLFFFDQAEHIRDATVIECDTDADAIARALEKHDGRAMELWLRTHLIKQFPTEPSGPKPPFRPKG